MAKQERQKRSTVNNQITAITKLNEHIAAPFALSEEESEIFYGIISSRERETWSKHDLRQAAKLARLEVQYEKEQILYLQEGTVMENQRGTQVENPRGRACATIQLTIKNLTTGLGLSASQRGIAGSKQSSRNEFEILQQQDSDADGLLA